jgi:indolepyruvate ferredoxin oxidoreductase
MLARMKSVRGTGLDLFGYTKERKMERRLIVDYTALVERLLSELTPANYDVAVKLARLPTKIRGYGHIKERNLEQVKAEQQELLAQFADSQPVLAQAAE